MKKIISALVLCTALSQPVFAILPPLYESSREITAIMTSEQLGQKLAAGELITVVRKNDKGFEITTNQHRLQVDVVYDKTSHRIGLAEFTLKFHDAQKLEP